METRYYVLANDLPLLSVVLINQCPLYPCRHHFLLTGEFSAVIRDLERSSQPGKLPFDFEAQRSGEGRYAALSLSVPSAAKLARGCSPRCNYMLHHLIPSVGNSRLQHDYRWLKICDNVPNAFKRQFAPWAKDDFAKHQVL